jgi:UDP-N-acetylglucosamine 2-epimerase (non-hydrolysing)
MTILVVAAARPNFMKVAPILDEFDRLGEPTSLVHTGQHYDHAMSDSFFADLGMRAPEVHLSCTPGTHAETTARVMLAFDDVVAKTKPDAVVVVGDVDSTLACALVAAKRGVPVAHVEAGLRSNDRTMPEEINRILVDAVADWLLTPSPDATTNLVNEGVSPARIHWVGNVMVDSLRRALTTLDVTAIQEKYGLHADSYALLTLHRPSNVDDLTTLLRLADAVTDIANRIPVVFPVHPRTAQRLAHPAVEARLKSADGLRLIAPISYHECVGLQAGAAMVLTDSGGLQEETTVLGVPCLTLRESTERPITVTHGTNTVVGTDPQRILEEAHRILQGDSAMAPPAPAGWDGHAAERVVRVITTVSPPLDADRQSVARQPVIPEPSRQRAGELT